ncbi:MAG: Gfo/Idh/MocA family oxidoreductase [Gemmatimonadota bacterium]
MRFGVVGAGVIGQLRAQSVREHPGSDLVGVFDPDRAAAQAALQGSGGRVADSVAQLLSEGIDALIVSSPVHFHEEACVEALSAGVHVLCEKPMSNSVDSCRRIVEAAEKSGRILAVGFNHRYYPSMKFLKSAIDRGAIGALQHVRVFGGHDGLHNFRADWQYKAPESGGGAMMDVGIHMTDLARYVVGEITDVYGVMSNRVWKVDGSEDDAVAVFRSPEGVPVWYLATWNEWRGYGFYVEAYGDLGMVRGFYAPMQNLLITHERPGGPRKKVRKLYPEIMIREKLKSWTSTALMSFKDELNDFHRRVAGSGGEALADGYAGLRAVEVAAAVRTSTETREAVHLPALGMMAAASR